MSKCLKIFVLVFFILVLFKPVTSEAVDLAGVFSDVLKGINPDSVTNWKEAEPFVQFCNDPGFTNKIVNCINKLATKKDVFRTLGEVNKQFSMVTNVCLVLYIMFFGLKLSMNVVENVRGEIMTVLITCFFITYVNNLATMENFVNFFIGFENEFVNVATISIYSSQADAATNYANGDDTFSHLACDNVMTTRVVSPEKTTTTTTGGVTTTTTIPEVDEEVASAKTYLGIWNRVDCVISYIVGSHPLVERKGELFNTKGTTIPSDSLVTQALAVIPITVDLDNKYIYPFPDQSSTPQAPPRSFKDMSTGGYMWGPFAETENIFSDASAAANGSPPDFHTIVQHGLTVVQDPNVLSLDLINDARPVNNDLISVTMSFSLPTIMVGMLATNPAIGALVFLVGSLIMIMIIAAFGQAILVYITSLFAIMALGIFAPLILPTFLFKQTKQIFEKWVQLLFAYSIQPGIVLCYLSFMIYVLQYVISYKGCISPNTTGPTAQTNSSCNLNIADYHFGPSYTKANKDRQDIVKITNKVVTGRTGNYTENAMQSSYTTKSGTRSDEQQYYLVNKGLNPIGDIADKIATEDKPLLEGAVNFNSEGTDQKSLSVPGFSFYGGDLLGKADIGGALAKLFFNYDRLNSNPTSSAQNAQNGVDTILPSELGLLSSDPSSACVKKTPNQSIDLPPSATCLIKLDQQQQFNMQVGYLQSLLTIFLTLAITFVFMNNVMDFTGKLVGVSVTPIGKAANIYNFATHKIGKLIKS